LSSRAERGVSRRLLHKCMPATKVLLIDDEPAIAKALRPLLQGHNFSVVVAETGADGLAQAESFTPDLILLDMGLPDMNGVELAAELRRRTDVPIIVLSVRDAEHDKVAALDNGADDYLTKPFGFQELLARIRVALRHRQQASPIPPQVQQVTIGDVLLDAERHQVVVRGESVHLSPTEFDLLETLMRNAGKLVTHRTLLHKVWGSEYVSDTQLLRVYIGHLRAKIEERPERPSHIVTEPGIGYRFRDEE
jgi:two-component system, OmpR family, KDP operon response regulator KdpE